ncbi:Dehydrogenase/reductase SDR member 12 [Bulinus truncatus]|nr:Dehydrogenase/reductase SDR member 12 [Bulinus truncatus]
MSLYRNAVWLLKGMREYTKSGYQNASKSFITSDLDANITHRTFMITGANSGLGRAAATAIAKKGGIVHIVCRNQERGEAALKELKEESGNQNIFLHLLDLSKPREIKSFGDKFNKSGSSLDVLVNNAGILGGEKRETTEDGLETTFATNTFGVHLLTQALLPVLEKSADPRVGMPHYGCLDLFNTCIHSVVTRGYG